MKIFILTVNYNSENELYNFIISIKNSLKRVSNLKIDMLILDNSNKTNNEFNKFKNEFEFSSENINIQVVTNNINSGYFGGLGLLKQKTNSNSYNFSIYCNPDILLDEFFFKELIFCKDIGIISPAIITLDSGYNQNPMYLNRIEKRKLIKLQIVFSNIMFYNIYHYLSALGEVIFKKNLYKNNKKEIYATHGSIFIFSDNNFVNNIPMYPCFLFGEEIFIAEEAIINNIKTYYHPEIIVRDIRHSALSQETSEFKRKHLSNSIKFLLKQYY